MAVTLSRTAPSAAEQARDYLGPADTPAVVCAASAGVHAALVLPHVQESSALAVAFGMATAALAVAALRLAVPHRPTETVVVSGLLLTVALAYVLSRTTGIPWLTHHPEPFDPLGSTISSLEAGAAVATLLPLTRRRS
jgi:hypothetical protein